MAKQCNFVIHLQYIFNLFFKHVELGFFPCQLDGGGAPYWPAATDFYCIFYQINGALVSIRDIKENNTDSKPLNGSLHTYNIYILVVGIDKIF